MPPQRAPVVTQPDPVSQSPVLGTPGGSPQSGASGGSDSPVSSSTTSPTGSEQGSSQEEQVDSSVRDMFLRGLTIILSAIMNTPLARPQGSQMELGNRPNRQKRLDDDEIEGTQYHPFMTC